MKTPSIFNVRNALLGILSFGLSLYAHAGAVGKSTPAGFTDDLEAARAEAVKSGKMVLAVFSGSDWCHWCKVLEREYLAKPEFVEEAKKDFVLVFIDSPSDKSLLSETAKRENERLVEKYGIKGFPTVKILKADGSEVAESRPEDGVTPKGYAEQLRRHSKVGPLAKQHLAAFEDELKKATAAAFMEMMRQVPSGGGDGDPDAAEKAQFEMTQKVMAGLAVKYRAIRDKAAKAEVPAEVEGEKASLLEKIDSAIENMEQMQKAKWEDVKKAKGRTRANKAGPQAAVRGLVVPLPEDAKLETEYFDKVAMPFYRARIVDAYRPASGVAPEVAERVRAVRRALARALATGRDEFPTHEEFEVAHRLWREKCRDAAVAILHSDGLSGDDRYWQSEKIYNEAVAAFDFASDPFMGFLLRFKAMAAGRYRISRNEKVNRKPVKEAEAACSNAFAKVADVFRNADRRIAERLDEKAALPDGAAEALGNEYLLRCHRAKACMDIAFEKRGSSWGKDVSEEGWKGWREYNDEAMSNLVAAVAMRPEDSRAQMMLASLCARYCGSEDPVALMNLAVSNSLDRAAETIERVIHFRTSRWGGSTAFLKDVVRAATTNVCTGSTFAYRAAAAALSEIFVAEMDGVANTNLANAVLTPELSGRLYGMFDAYITAPESPYMPSRDTFVGMAVSLALEKRDWRTVRKYAAMYGKPLRSWQDAWWIRLASHSSDRLYLYNIFDAIGGDARRRDLFIDAEIAIAEGRNADAERFYGELRRMGGLSRAGKMIVDRQGFKVRKEMQEAKGGWVDVMPTASACEGESWWGVVGTKPDGRARVGGKGKSYYRLEIPLPGKGAEYEATVHFETNDAKQAKWFIGWGLARPYTGYCARKSSWAYPYIGFWRDETGDHVTVECPTSENTDSKKPEPKSKYGQNEGMYPKWEVYRGALERCDDHSFGLRWDEQRLSVSVDGREVWSVPTQEVMSVSRFRENIQSDYSVLPVWKVFGNTSFSGYRYRRIVEK